MTRNVFVYLCVVSVSASPKVQFGFYVKLPKIYEMCLHVLLDVEVGLRESKGWWAHTLSFPESTFSNNSLFSFSRARLGRRLHDSWKWRISFFSVLFAINLYDRLGEGALGQSKPSPLLGSALVGANKKGASVCKYADRSKRGGIILLLKSAQSWNVIFLTILLAGRTGEWLCRTLSVVLLQTVHWHRRDPGFRSLSLDKRYFCAVLISN